MEIRKSVHRIPTPLPTSHPCEVEGILEFGYTSLFLKQSLPLMTACFSVEKSVNAWPALAERLHTSTKLNPFVSHRDCELEEQITQYLNRAKCCAPSASFSYEVLRFIQTQTVGYTPTALSARPLFKQNILHQEITWFRLA